MNICIRFGELKSEATLRELVDSRAEEIKRKLIDNGVSPDKIKIKTGKYNAVRGSGAEFGAKVKTSKKNENQIFNIAFCYVNSLVF